MANQEERKPAPTSPPPGPVPPPVAPPPVVPTVLDRSTEHGLLEERHHDRREGGSEKLADRVGRSEYVGKLARARQLIKTLAIRLHQDSVHAHSGEFMDCENTTCVEARSYLRE